MTANCADMQRLSDCEPDATLSTLDQVPALFESLGW